MKPFRRPRLLRKPSLSPSMSPLLSPLLAPSAYSGCSACSECCGESACATNAPNPDVLHDIFDAIASLHRAFEARLAHDAFRQQQIDRLHHELQEHKSGLLHKIQRPYIMGLIQLHDNLGRSMDHLQAQNENQGAPMPLEDVQTLLHSFQEDIEMLMEQNAIFPFMEEGTAFNPARQTSLKTVPATQPEMAGQVAQHVRPGFVQELAIVQKERVCVYTQPQ